MARGELIASHTGIADKENAVKPELYVFQSAGRKIRTTQAYV